MKDVINNTQSMQTIQKKRKSSLTRRKRGRTPQDLIHFSTMFEPSMKRRIKIFLESDTRAATLTRALLFIAALGGVVAISIAAPNLFKILRVPDYAERGKRLNKEGFLRSRRACYQLEQRGLIERDFTRGSSNRWRLTLLGKEVIEKIVNSTKKEGAEATVWDGKMRLIIFDVPNAHQYARDAFRHLLKVKGCYPLQRSVWAYPFSCKKELLAAATRLRIQDHVEVYTLEDFDNKNALSFLGRFFKLKHNIHNHDIVT